MRLFFITTFTFFYIFSLGQGFPKTDTHKIFLEDTSLVNQVLVISNDTILTYGIKPKIRKDGVYQIFSDPKLTKIIYQTEFMGNYKVGQDIYWYPNGIKSMQFETTETGCTDSVNYMTVYCTRSTMKVGQYFEWYPNGKPKATGKYILTDRCSSRKNGNWKYWDEKGKMTVITYKQEE